MEKGAIRWTPIVNENNLRQVAISPDGVYMAAVGERLHLVNLRTTEHEWTVPGNSPSHASFSPNSATLTASTLDKCRVFITAAGKQLRMLKPPTKATATASAFANDDVMMTVWQGTGNSGVRSVTAHRVMSGTLLAVSAAIMASGSIACGLGLIGTLDNGLLQTWDWGRNPGSKEETLRTFAFEVTGDDDATLLGYCNSPCPRIFALVLEKVRLRFGMPPELWVDVIARSRVYGKRAVLWLASLGTLKMVDVESGESILRRKLKVVEFTGSFLSEASSSSAFGSTYSLEPAATTLGPEKHLDAHLQSCITFLADVREFMRERADLEREFARKLESLSRKHIHRKEKRCGAQGVPHAVSAVAGAADAVGFQAEFETLDGLVSTTERAWGVILQTTESRARMHLTLSDSLTQGTAEKLKTLSSKKEDARKKHLIYAQKLIAEREKAFAEKDRAKKVYDDACDLVETAKSRHDRAADDKSREKLKKAWHQEIIQLNNSKNMYILAIEMANAIKKKYYRKDLPSLLQEMQSLSESILQSLKTIWSSHAEDESTFITSFTTALATMSASVKAIDALRDSDPRCPASPTPLPLALTPLAPADFKFTPSMLWKDTTEMSKDEFSRVFLTNTLRKVRRKMGGVEASVLSRKRAVDGMCNLLDVYVRNPQQGDAHDVKENILEIEREMTFLENTMTKLQTEEDAIVACIGGGRGFVCDCTIDRLVDISPDDKFHEFKSTTFTIPTACDYCRQSVWGVTKPGLTCTVLVETSRPGVGALAFVLYDYTPPAEASPEEIQVNEGDCVTIMEEDDGSGWIKVRSREVVGLVPTSYIEIRRSSSPTRTSCVSPSSAASPHRHSTTSNLSLSESTSRPVSTTTFGVPSVLDAMSRPLSSTSVASASVVDGETSAVSAEPQRKADLIGTSETSLSTDTLIESHVELLQAIEDLKRDEGGETSREGKGLPSVMITSSSTPSLGGSKAVRMALFDYMENGEDEITIKSGQIVWLVEDGTAATKKNTFQKLTFSEDDGSGWVTVNDGNREGLVPASYLSQQ
ncbi:hypothetical protein HK101_004737 [Irineochytrium annulatum]|nr:hypothetical protein HK101_004737 [Irineochytrium annulatum]